jgi:hypothetical protein
MGNHRLTTAIDIECLNYKAPTPPEALDKIKGKAAALGTNGLLLIMPNGDYQFEVGAGYAGAYHHVPMHKNPKTAVNPAIYVCEE